MTPTAAALPLWLEAIVALLVLAGASVALLGAIGLLRLRTFFERVHAPAIVSTMGCWLIMHATVLYFSVVDGSLALHALLLAVFVAITVPIMSIFLMRAALFRARQAGQNVPPSLNAQAAAPLPPTEPPTENLPENTPERPVEQASDTISHPAKNS